MHKEVLSRWDQPIYPITALIIFLVCFAAYAYWTYKRSNKKFYEETSLIVLEDGVKHEQ